LHAAVLGNTILVDVDLSNAKQLETCQFRAPAGIDFRTMIRSGHLPVPFLRGCGLPEKVIENLPALLTENIDQYSVVIKSAEEDKAFVERLHADLQARGVRCWPATATSSKWHAAGPGFTLESYFRPHETRLIVVLSQHAASNGTPWIERDAQLWIQNEHSRNRRLLFVTRLDDNVPPAEDAVVESELQARAIDFRRWKDHKAYVHALNRLVALLSS
jgi:TIR domain